jgi:hypothetical protein
MSQFLGGRRRTQSMLSTPCRRAQRIVCPKGAGLQPRARAGGADTADSPPSRAGATSKLLRRVAAARFPTIAPPAGAHTYTPRPLCGHSCVASRDRPTHIPGPMRTQSCAPCRPAIFTTGIGDRWASGEPIRLKPNARERRVSSRGHAICASYPACLNGSAIHAIARLCFAQFPQLVFSKPASMI